MEKYQPRIVKAIAHLRISYGWMLVEGLVAFPSHTMALEDPKVR